MTEEVKQLKKEIQERLDKIERLCSESKRAKRGKLFYFIDSVGGVMTFMEDYSPFSDLLWKTGNYFLTEGAAEKVAKGKKAFIKLSSMADRKPYEEGYSVTVDIYNKKLSVGYYIVTFNGLPRFSSMGKAFASLDLIDAEALIDYLEAGFI